MSQTLVDRFMTDCHIPVVSGSLREAFLGGEGVRVLFITGDTARRPETGDLTVVLREVLNEFPGRVQIAVADRGEESLFRERFAIKVFPKQAGLQGAHAVLRLRTGAMHERVGPHQIRRHVRDSIDRIVVEGVPLGILRVPQNHVVFGRPSSARRRWIVRSGSTPSRVRL